MRSNAPVAAVLALVACAVDSSPSPASPNQAPPTAASVAPPADVAAPQTPEHWLDLRPGHHTAVPFALSIPAELASVQTRFARAVATQEAWVQQYLAELRLPPGAPLPYHPNLGVSEAEYQQLLHAYEHPIVVEADKRDLEVRIERGGLRFSAPEPLAAVDLLTLEAGGRARYGDVAVDGPERIDGLQGSFGTWSGFAWRHDASSPVSRTIDVLDVELGRVAGRRFLHLARRRGDVTAMTEVTELLAWID